MIISLFYLNYSVLKYASSLAVLLRANLKEPHFPQGTKHPSFSSFCCSVSDPARDAGSPRGSQSHISTWRHEGVSLCCGLSAPRY